MAGKKTPSTEEVSVARLFKMFPVAPRPGLLAVLILCRMKCDINRRISISDKLLSDLETYAGRILAFGLETAISFSLHGDGQKRFLNSICQELSSESSFPRPSAAATLTNDIEMAREAIKTIETDSNGRVKIDAIVSALAQVAAQLN